MRYMLEVSMQYKKSIFVVIFFTVVVLCKVTYAQHITEHGTITFGTLYQGDTIPLIQLPTVHIIETMSEEGLENYKKYLKLKRDVLRAYPYARLAGVKLRFINDSLKHITSERLQKKFIKETEKELKKQFESDLKNLTISQGRILIRLIDRETGNTSYQLVKDLRGGFQAFMWQSLARLFGSNLKDQYDATNEDKLIESIIQQIEKGQLQVTQN